LKKKVAVLTGGGHIGALNAGLYGVRKKGKELGWKIYGALDGWQGLARGNFIDLLDYQVNKYADSGGSILGSSRYKPELEELANTIAEHDIDAVVAFGGDDTLGVLAKLWNELGIPAVGWPKTMDNDLSGTYFTIGYPTAVSRSSQLVRESVDMAYTHGRVMINTLFGRSTDWVAAGAAAYGDADILIPGEKPTEIEEVYERVKEVYLTNQEKYGKGFVTLVAAEGASIEGLPSHRKESEEFDEFGHVKLDPNLLALNLSEAIRDRSEEEYDEPLGTAYQALTYLLRNGSANEVDRNMGYKAGRRCMRLIENDNPGRMVAVQYEEGNDLSIGSVDLTNAVKLKVVRDTDHVDYSGFRVSDSYLIYSSPFLGDKKGREISLLK